MAISAILATSIMLQDLKHGEVFQGGNFEASDAWNPGSVGEIVSDPEAPGGRFLRVRVSRGTPDTPWSTALYQTVQPRLEPGKMDYSFWVRSPDGARLRTVFEQRTDPWTKLLNESLDLAPRWTEVRGSLNLSEVVRSGSHQFGFQFAERAGTIDIAQVSVKATTRAAPPRPTLARPEPLIPAGRPEIGQAGPTAWELGTSAPPQVEARSEGRPHLRFRLDDKTAAAQPWFSQFGRLIDKPVQQGDVIFVRVVARSSDGAGPTVVFEQSQEPHAKSISRRLQLSKDWKEFRLAAPSGGTYEAGESQFKLFFGGQKGTVDIAELEVLNVGPRPDMAALKLNVLDYEPGSDAWRREAEARIERIRKGDARLQVVGPDGRPFTGTLQVNQVRHAFRFGTAVTAEAITGQGADFDRYRAALEEGFNTVVFENDMKWGPMESWDWARVETAAAWLKQRGFLIRGHNLVWGSSRYLPFTLAGRTNEEINRMIDERFVRATSKTKGMLYVWDVVNEAVTETELWDLLGWDRFTGAFKRAKELAPDVLTAYNDFNISNDGATGPNHRRQAIRRARQIIDAGAPLDIFGDQAHQSPPGTPMPQVLAAWDEVTREVKRPIEITEFDFVSWDDASHAAYTKDYLTAAFSHPNVEAFIFWGFWAQRHWLAERGGAMILADWTPRPAWTGYLDLVNRKWRTRLTLPASQRSFRGFLGDYRVTARSGGRTLVGTFTLEKGQSSVIRVTLQPEAGG
ncbi:MAG: endo-1,4-beta-xylanase [Fimbriimonadaceae bacterium]|nr:endo-1,4-beta-xylanase [Fimbriimonadaceae bacterium]